MARVTTSLDGLTSSHALSGVGPRGGSWAGGSGWSHPMKMSVSINITATLLNRPIMLVSLVCPNHPQHRKQFFSEPDSANQSNALELLGSDDSSIVASGLCS